MTRLYLLRHGTAEPHSDCGPRADDASRELVEKGRAQARQVAALMTRMSLRLDLVIASPYARARQTAEELIAHLLPEDSERGIELRLDERLIYTTPVDAALAMLGEAAGALADRAALCAVGHEPLLSELAAALVGPDLAMALRKGGLVEIELDATGGRPRGYLLGLLRPRHLRGGGAGR